ncbi:MAG: sialate O-acetylesterase [Eubacteriales bacterium]|nr:sialate O-acetylesterase [Eubacteriales bacterium]
MIHSFLLIGQSNMAGRGFINEAKEINTERIKILRNGRWQGMYRPINGDRGYSGVSLAESFAEKYANDHGVDVGLICCADGGTSLNQWQPGGLLYDNAVYQARLASRTSTIAGVLWHQGESDCAPDLYPTYEIRLDKMHRSLRKDLDLYDVPILLGGLGDFLMECPHDERLKNYQQVNNALENVARASHMMGYVSATDLGSNPDKLHFNAEALYEFGLRYYKEFDKLRDKNKVFKDKPHPDDALRTSMELL